MRFGNRQHIEFISLKDGFRLLGISPATGWRRINDHPDFPKPVAPFGPGTKARRFVKSEITAYQAKIIAQRDRKSAA